MFVSANGAVAIGLYAPPAGFQQGLVHQSTVVMNVLNA